MAARVFFRRVPLFRCAVVAEDEMTSDCCSNGIPLASCADCYLTGPRMVCSGKG